MKVCLFFCSLSYMIFFIFSSPFHFLIFFVLNLPFCTLMHSCFFSFLYYCLQFYLVHYFKIFFLFCILSISFVNMSCSTSKYCFSCLLHSSTSLLYSHLQFYHVYCFKTLFSSTSSLSHCQFFLQYEKVLFFLFVAFSYFSFLLAPSVFYVLYFQTSFSPASSLFYLSTFLAVRVGPIVLVCCIPVISFTSTFSFIMYSIFRPLSLLHPLSFTCQLSLYYVFFFSACIPVLLSIISCLNYITMYIIFRYFFSCTFSLLSVNFPCIRSSFLVCFEFLFFS